MRKYALICTISTILIFLIIFCQAPVDPKLRVELVNVELFLSDSVTTVKETFCFDVAIEASEMADSIVVDFGDGFDTTMFSKKGVFYDTLRQCHIYKTAGQITVRAKAFRKDGRIEERSRSIIVQREKGSDTLPPQITLVSHKNSSRVNRDTTLVQVEVFDSNGVISVLINNDTAQYVNQKYQKMVVLQLGDNEIIVIATDVAGNTQQRAFTVTYDPDSDDTQPPIITLFSHHDGDTVGIDSVEVQVDVTDENMVKSVIINGENVDAVGGKYIHKIGLNEGKNIIDVTAKDNSNNSNQASESFILYYDPDYNDHTKPLVNVITPADNQSVEAKMVTVQVEATDASGIANVTINGNNAALVDGYYSKEISLESGPNTISIIATDKSKNNNADTVIITVSSTENKNSTPTLILKAPVNGAEAIGSDVGFVWSGSDPDEDRLQYKLYLGLDQDNLEAIATTSDTFSHYQAISGKEYYWKVVADDGKHTVSSIVRSFTTNTIPVVSLLNPENGAANLDKPVTLSWSGTDADINDMLQYTVYLDTDPEPMERIAADIKTTTIEVSDLMFGTKYYWKVDVSDTKASSSSGVFWFKLGEGARITRHPTDDTLNLPNGEARFGVSASGNNLTYKWTKNGIIISGETASSIEISNGNHGDAFRCIVQSDVGLPDTSNEAVLHLAYQVATSVSGSGTISPNNPYLIHGSDAIFTFSANQQNVMTKIKIDNVTKNAAHACTLKNVRSTGHTVSGEFKTVMNLLKRIPSRNKTFRMGTHWKVNNEYLTPHDVTFTYDFYMDSIEVTQTEYKALMNNVNPSYVSFVRDNWPVAKMTWYDAILFCNARSKKEGLDTVYTYSGVNGTPGDSCILTNVQIHYERIGYRLPTEAEWEFAYMGGTSSSENDYFWGSTFSNSVSMNDSIEIDKYTVWPRTSNGDPDPAGTRIPNGYGLHNMPGNVIEFCNDWRADYPAEAQVDPTGPASGTVKAIRGGRFDGKHVVSVTRFWRNWDLRPEETRYFIGFRCVITSK